MTFTVEQKSQLAKLLATENLTIEHKKVATAAFDPKNRVLYCPIWQDMSGALYDLLMGHEVGHALYTPAEGWHEAASSRGKNFKGFLNVVEDARIEKKIRRKYPGLRNSFVKGYQSLIDRDFFDVKGRDLNELSFIDRVNIHTKLGTLVNIQFAEGEEQDLLKQVEACETWADVLRVTQAVFDYSKNEQFETLQKMLSSQIQTGANSDDDFDGEESDGEELDDAEQTYGEKRNSKGGEEGQEQESDGESDGEYDEDGEDNKLNRYKDSQVSKTDQSNFEPTCETDNSFRKNEGALLDDQCKPYLYLKFPTPILENIVTPASVVHKALGDYYSDDRYNNILDKSVNEFKNKNDRYIGLLAKEFEMKKAAKAYAKVKVSNTGDIDISRLYRYQVDDNIFRKSMRVPKGKSHGLVLLLDRSGSMVNNMAGSIEQILVLSAFCRKVNIPFVVYGFGNSIDGRMYDYGKEEYGKKCFTQNINEFAFDNVYLREYLSSKMSGSEYNKSIRNLIALKLSYEQRYFGRPLNEELSNTPLNEAMVALEPIVQKFRKLNNLDLVNLVVVHDGDADNSCSYMTENDMAPNSTVLRPKRFYTPDVNVIINHGKRQMKVANVPHDHYSYDDGLRIAIFDWFQKETGSKIFGFFIAGDKYRMRDSVTQRYINQDGESVYATVKKQLGSRNTHYVNFSKTDYVKDLVSILREHKFIQSYNRGYESFFIMPGGSDLSIENDELIISGAVTANKLKTAFMKMNKKKQFSRVMVSRFIEGIAS